VVAKTFAATKSEGIAKRPTAIQKAELPKIDLKPATIEKDLLRKTHNVDSIKVSSDLSYIR
jgi:hypothetical protein